MNRVTLVYGTVYGSAESVAESLEAYFIEQGLTTSLIEEATIDDITQLSPQEDLLIVITSTTGQGDLPETIYPLHQQLSEQFPLLNGLPFKVVALGDSSYTDSYCGAGQKMQTLLEELQGKPLSSMLAIDSLETMEPEQDALAWAQSFIEQRHDASVA
ncbi:flavodoxin [Paraferrimonas haliotis]|uniref:Flavodoxin n=1 Tax=Paraferrimonas haliotis TaxID=2013866 RepID=A0AA37WXM8_9GAMM|nr:flavodoxin [Paraferrimonas haliotis]GLS82730.1 flavodoxin [Paraferrimonas haliotis]